MSENKTFFRQAAQNQVGIREIFTDVFRRHTPEENARLFMAGTALTTPREQDMLAKWTKPYMFARIFLAGLILFIVSSFLSASILPTTIPFTFGLGSFLIPMTVMFFFWEMNIPRNISFPSVIVLFLAGGMASLVFTGFLNNFIENAQTATALYMGVGIVEELGKVAAIACLLRSRDKKYILTGMLVGSAVGAGFASIESFGYALSYGFSTLIGRALLAIGGHVSWAAVSGGALAMAKRDEELSIRHFLSPVFVGYLCLVIALHAIWDLTGVTIGIIYNFTIHIPFLLGGFDIIIPLNYILLCIIIVCVAFFLVKQGLNQVVAAAMSGNYNSLTRAVEHDPFAFSGGGANPYIRQDIPAYMEKNAGAQAVRIQGISGSFAGRRFPLDGRVRVGRDPGKNNLVYPAGTFGISGQHCELTARGGHIYIMDLGSTYGTYVNGKRLKPKEPCEIHIGDHVCLGSAHEELQIDKKRS